MIVVIPLMVLIHDWRVRRAVRRDGGYATLHAMLGVLFTLMAVLVVLGWCDYVISPADVQRACTEDMACWDCTSMGNGICGRAS